jgi:hypothetical protein
MLDTRWTVVYENMRQVNGLATLANELAVSTRLRIIPHFVRAPCGSSEYPSR